MTKLYRHHYDEWRRLYEEGKGLNDIALQFGCNLGTVWYALKTMGVPRRPTEIRVKSERFKPLHDEWVRLYNEGMRTTEIGAKFGADRLTVLRVVRKAGSKIRTSGEQNRKYFIGNDHAFDQIDTWEKAYWLGFLMADGCVNDDSTRHKWVLQVNLQQGDADHLRKLAHFLQTDAPLHQVEKTNSVHFAVYSESLVRGLIQCGCVPRKSLITQIAFDKIPSQFLSGFVLGDFDGDGSVISTKGSTARVSWCSGSFEFLQDLHKILDEQPGVRHARYSTPRAKSKTRQLETQRQDDVMRVYHWLYGNATVCLERKKRKFDELLFGGVPNGETAH